MTVVNCRFLGNTAQWGGAISCGTEGAAIINCEFSGNQAERGGAVNGGSISLVNSTLAGNSATEAGAAIFTSDLGVRMTNCIVWENVLPPGTTPTVQIDGSATASHSCIQGGFDGMGNTAADPLLLRIPDPGPDGIIATDDDDFGDLRLRSESVCIDAGDNTAVPTDALDLDDDGDTTEPVPFDLARNTRFRDDFATTDTGNGLPPIVDMGAYELPGMPALRRIVGGLDAVDNSASMVWPKAEEIALQAFEIETDQVVSYVESSVTTTGGTVPTVTAFAHVGGVVHRVQFDGPIPLSHWTLVTLTVTDATGGESTFEICLGHLPADINGDGQVNMGDVTAFGAYFGPNASAVDLVRVDLNGNGQTNLNDATLMGQLWHGTSGHSAWQNASLPVRDGGTEGLRD